MNVRSALMTVLACFVGAVVAIASLGQMCTWLVDDAGSATRTALILSNAPWFEANRSSASTPLAAPVSKQAREGGLDARHDARSPDAPAGGY